MFVFFLLPLLIWLYLPIRGSQNPPLNWNTPSTLKRFINQISGFGYGGYFSTSLHEQLQNLMYHINHFFTHQFFIFVIVGLIGGFILFYRKIPLFIFLFLIILADIIHSIRYHIANIEDYYIPAFIIFVIWIGCEIQSLLMWFYKFKNNLILYFLSGVLILSPIIPLKMHYFYNNEQLYYFGYERGFNILSQLKENAIVFAAGDDDIFPTWYLYYVERYRQDITVLLLSYLHQNWYVEQIKKNYPWLKFTFTPMESLHPIELENIMKERFNSIVNENIAKYPFYFSLIKGKENMVKDYTLVPTGALYQIFLKNIKLGKILDNSRPKFRHRGLHDKEIFKDQRIMDIVHDDASILRHRGILYYKLGMYDKAIREIKESLKIISDYTLARNNLGSVYSEKKEYNKAIEEFNKVLRKEPNNIEAYRGLGKVYEEKKDFKKAITIYIKMGKIYPKNVETHYSLARVYHYLGMTDKVIFECKEVIKLEPNNIEVHKNLGLLYYNKGLFEEARKEFNYILEIDSNNSYAKKMLQIISKKFRKEETKT